MNIFAGKTPTERNKIIAATVLGVLSLFSLYLAFGGSIFSSKPAVTVNVTSTPTPTPGSGGNNVITPVQVNEQQVYLEYQTTPVIYQPGAYGSPDAGRNIFAFYEPPPPTPYSPTPLPTPPPAKPPTPEPTPPQFVAFITPQSVYAGTKAFRLDVSGQNFTPETRILFNGSELPTTFVSPQQLSAEIPANLITSDGPRQIMTATPDGNLFSNTLALNVEAPPTPKLRYIGILGRKRYNNDTAYFQEENSSAEKEPTAARLNDVVGSRFRVVSISSKEVVLEDVNLGFRHKLALYTPPAGSSSGGNNFPNRRGGGNEVYQQYQPQIPNVQYPNVQPQLPPQQEIPGIPSNIPRYNPNQPNQPNPSNQPPRQNQKDDNDDDDDDGKPE